MLYLLNNQEIKLINRKFHFKMKIYKHNSNFKMKKNKKSLNKQWMFFNKMIISSIRFNLNKKKILKSHKNQKKLRLLESKKMVAVLKTGTKKECYQM